MVTRAFPIDSGTHFLAAAATTSDLSAQCGASYVSSGFVAFLGTALCTWRGNRTFCRIGGQVYHSAGAALFPATEGRALSFDALS